MPSIFGHLLSSLKDETEEGNLLPLVDCFLLFTDKFRSTCWALPETMHLLLSALRKQLSQAPSIISPALLPLVCSLPASAIAVTSTTTMVAAPSSSEQRKARTRTEGPTVTSYVHDDLSQFIFESAELTNDASLTKELVSSLDAFVVEASLVLLLRKPLAVESSADTLHTKVFISCFVYHN